MGTIGEFKVKYELKTGEIVSVSNLIGTNAKLQKEVTGLGYTTAILGISLAPAVQSGYNVCTTSTPACRQACVTWFSGRRVMNEVRQSAIARTKLWLLDRQRFIDDTIEELRLLLRRSRKTHDFDRVYLRPNVSSDIPWERFGLVEKWGQYVDGLYDYTANVKRMLDSLGWNHNYRLTFSVKEDTPQIDVERVLSAGGNVAIVVDVPYWAQRKTYGLLPEYVRFGSRKRYRVIDGDLHDFRHPDNDGQGNVVLLRLKGTLSARQTAREYRFAKQIDLLGVDSQPSIAKGVTSKLWL